MSRFVSSKLLLKRMLKFLKRWNFSIIAKFWRNKSTQRRKLSLKFSWTIFIIIDWKSDMVVQSILSYKILASIWNCCYQFYPNYWRTDSNIDFSEDDTELAHNASVTLCKLYYCFNLKMFLFKVLYFVLCCYELI